MKSQYRSILYSLFLLLLMLSSCIGEDDSSCPADGIRLYFSYRTTYADWTIDPAEVNRINVFVFDKDGKFVGEWIDENPRMSPSYYMELPLQDGSYQLVCWAGLKECYLLTPYPPVVGVTHIDDCLLSLQRSLQQTVEHAPNHLFHAGLNGCTIDRNTRTYILGLKQLTNTINLTTEGLKTTTSLYSLSIEDDNGDYKFDCSHTSQEKFHYITPCINDAQGQPAASLRVLELSRERITPELSLTNTTTGQVVYRANLIDLLLQLKKQGVAVDLDNVHNYDIHLKFGDTGFDVQVSVNGWILNDSQAEV